MRLGTANDESFARTSGGGPPDSSSARGGLETPTPSSVEPVVRRGPDHRPMVEVHGLFRPSSVASSCDPLRIRGGRGGLR